MKTITIRFNKLRSILGLFIGGLYAGIGISFLIDSPEFFFISLPFVLFFGRRAWYSWQELRGKRFALILDQDGIVDNIYWHSVGRISWEDVLTIETQKKFPLIRVIQLTLKDQSAVLGREKNILKRLFQAIQLLLKKGSLIYINTWILAGSYEELSDIFVNIDLDNIDFMDLSEHLIV